MNTPKRAPSTAASKSASAKKMLGDFPPSSRPTFLRVSAAERITALPTSTLPVNAILSTPGWATRGAPAVSPKPVTTFTTPLGRPHSSKRRPSSSRGRGVCSAGWLTMAKPARFPGAGVGDAREHVAGRRVEDVEMLAGDGFGPRAVDENLIRRHENLQTTESYSRAFTGSAGVARAGMARSRASSGQRADQG